MTCRQRKCQWAKTRATVPVGHDIRRTNESLSLAEAGRVAGCAGEKLEIEPCIPHTVQGPGQRHIPSAKRGRCDHRIVLKIVCPGDGVTVVVRSDAVVIQVDSKTRVGDDRIAEDRPSRVAGKHADARAIEGNEVARAGSRAPDGAATASTGADLTYVDAATRVGDRHGAGDIGPDPVSLYESRGRRSDGDDALAGDAGDQIPRADSGTADCNVRHAEAKVVCDFDSGPAATRYTGRSGRVGPNQVALNRGRSASGFHTDAEIAEVAEDIASAGGGAADGVAGAVDVQEDSIESRESPRSGRVDTDIVALHGIPGAGPERDDPTGGRHHVARGRRRAADRVARVDLKDDRDIAGSHGHHPGRVGPEEVAGDHVVVAAVRRDPGRKAVDHQPAHRRASGPAQV